MTSVNDYYQDLADEQTREHLKRITAKRLCRFMLNSLETGKWKKSPTFIKAIKKYMTTIEKNKTPKWKG